MSTCLFMVRRQRDRSRLMLVLRRIVLRRGGDHHGVVVGGAVVEVVFVRNSFVEIWTSGSS